MLRHTEMCHQWVISHQNSLHKGPILVKKIHRRGFISPKMHTKKVVKSAVFETEKPLEMGPEKQKFQRKSQISHFSLEVTKNFRPCTAHPIKN